MTTNTWLVGLFPDAVQDEVFATPDVRVSGILSPTARAERRNGGFVVHGESHFHSGALHSQWSAIAAMSTTADGGPEPIVALIPTSALDARDDWDTAGLRGTGSVTTVAREIFVPGERVLSAVFLLQGQVASRRNADTPLYRRPMISFTARQSAMERRIGAAFHFVLKERGKMEPSTQITKRWPTPRKPSRMRRCSP